MTLMVAATPFACSPACGPRQANTLECGGQRGTGLGQGGVDGGSARCSNFSEFGLTCEEDFEQVGAFDIIWVVDSSGSMSEELAGVKEHINKFAQVISQSGVDFHLIMVGEQGTGSLEVCVAEPLGGPGCGNGPQFLHIDTEVGSTDAPYILMDVADNDPSFQGFVRPGSRRAVIFVTDDDATTSATTVLANMAGRTSLSGAVIHSVIGTTRQECPDLADEGDEYRIMSQQTGGLILPICCDDYAQLVNALALDVTQQNGRFTLERPAVASSVRVYSVDNTNTRTAIRDGWTYDADLRAVVFAPEALPAAGTRLVVTYSSRN